MTSSPEHPAQQRAQAARSAAFRLLVLVGAGVAVVSVIVLALVLGALAGAVGLGLGVVLGLVAGAGVAAWLFTGADARLEQRLGASPLSDEDDPRLFNLIDGLSAVVGVAPPPVVAIDDDGVNAGLIGVRRPPTLVVTTGLVGAFDRLELEAIIAHELHRIASEEHLVTSTAAGLVGWISPSWGQRLAGGPAGLDAEITLDAEAVGHTRYPPGLAAALERVDARPGPNRETLGVSWMIDPSERGRADVQTRVAALHER
ncbi:MAG: M48 family metalloprotease [Actinomycetota bacterium]